MRPRLSPGTSEKPRFADVMRGGASAGVVSALVNSAYATGYRAATGFDFLHPTYGSIAASSFFPSVLGALGCFALSRFTSKANAIFAAITCAITLYSFEGAFRATLPDGTSKPAGFDALTLPMHVVVGLVAALLIPLFSRRRLVLCWPA